MLGRKTSTVQFSSMIQWKGSFRLFFHFTFLLKSSVLAFSVCLLCADFRNFEFWAWEKFICPSVSSLVFSDRKLRRKCKTKIIIYACVKQKHHKKTSCMRPFMTIILAAKSKIWTVIFCEYWCPLPTSYFSKIDI